MAWEIVVTYRHFLSAKKRGLIKEELPHMSIITFGSAGLAIQNMLKMHNLPNLKCLIDEKYIDKDTLKSLKKLGAEIFETDLDKKAYNSEEILQMTNNKGGLDITSDEALDPTTRFYDWMSYEIINNNPDYVFVPFGSGHLYENILNINKKECSTKHHDPRFSGNVEILSACNFIGSTTNNPKTKAIKLYSPHLPFSHFNEQWIRLYKFAGFCGPDSGVKLMREDYLDEAIDLAESQGINCEPSGIAGLALMLQMKNSLPKNKKFLIVNTGKTKY